MLIQMSVTVKLLINATLQLKKIHVDVHVCVHHNVIELFASVEC